LSPEKLFGREALIVLHLSQAWAVSVPAAFFFPSLRRIVSFAEAGIKNEFGGIFSV
jgi:hypothetical protein